MEDDVVTSEAKYPYLHVDVPSADVDLASATLWELGAQGIEERDSSTLEGPEAVAPDGTTLVASFESEQAARDASEGLDGRWPAQLRFVVGDAWREAWRAYFKPSRVGQRLVVKPSWEPYDAQADDVVITLDPGCAFGTGTHATTRLVMATLEDVVPTHAGREPGRGHDVLDVGCGSGILAITAIKLGMRGVDAIDVDPDSVRVTLENAERNGVAGRIAASTTPVSGVTRQYPVVLANIEASVLIPMATALRQRVAPGGVLLLSGILTHQIDAIRDAYAPMRCLAAPTEGDWVCLRMED